HFFVCFYKHMTVFDISLGLWGSEMCISVRTVEDMGQLFVYLACAPNVTGQAIAVDGGFSL
ncbi:hypothetical protein ACLI4B_35835, partial [Pseudomonas aeruginosa]